MSTQGTNKEVNQMEYIDIGKAIKLYLKDGGSSDKESLIKYAEFEINQQMNRTIKNLSEATKEEIEQAFNYNFKKEAHSYYELKEITYEEFMENPAKKAFDKIIIYPVAFFPLSIDAYIAKAILKTNIIPSEKITAKRALKFLEEDFKKIQALPNCKSEIIQILASSVIGVLDFKIYYIYRPEEFEEFASFSKKANQEIMYLTSIERTEDIDKRIWDLYEKMDINAMEERLRIYNLLKTEKTIKSFLSKFGLNPLGPADTPLDIYTVTQYIKSGTSNSTDLNKRFGSIIVNGGAATLAAGVKNEFDPLSEDFLSGDIRPFNPLFNGFYNMHQGRATNLLATTTFKPTKPLNLKGEAVIEGEELKVILEKYNEIVGSISPTVKIFLDALIIRATENGQRDTLVAFPLRDYMEMRGLKSLKEARGQVDANIETLKKIKIDYLEKVRGKDAGYKPSGAIYLFGGTGLIKNSIVYFRFNPDFFKLILAYPIMKYPSELLKTNTKRNPHTYNLGRKIAELKNQNYFSTNNDIVSVKTLISSCPELPKYEDLAPDYQVEKRIIRPFERDMDALPFLTWEYCAKGGKPLNKELMKYSDFIEARIKIIWKDYPERPVKKRKTTAKKEGISSKN